MSPRLFLLALCLLAPACDRSEPPRAETIVRGGLIDPGAGSGPTVAPVVATPTVAPTRPSLPGVSDLRWETLASFYYHRWKDDKRGTIPPLVQALGGKKIRITGHMTPMKIAEKTQKVATFLLSRTSMECCFGVPPKVTEWIVVDVANPAGTEHTLLTVEAIGVLTVGEITNEYGEVGGIYRLRAERVAVNLIAGHPANAGKTNEKKEQ